MGILQVAINPVVASDIGYGRKVWRHSASPAVECVTLATTDREEKFFTIVDS